MFYAYILESVGVPGRRYVGFTRNLDRRLEAHNSGKCDHTRPYQPWRYAAFFAFRNEEAARGFERYLKSGSGRAFARRHFGV